MELGLDFTAFISHASADSERATEICASLEARGLKCWIAPRDVRPGRDYGEEILDGIRRSRCLVLVLSEAANDSTFVSKEVERAVTYGRPLFPVRIEEIVPSRSLEFFVSGSQWIDAWGDQLVTELGRLAESLPRHTTGGKSDAEGSGPQPGVGGGSAQRDGTPSLATADGPDPSTTERMRGQRPLAALGVIAAVVIIAGLAFGERWPWQTGDTPPVEDITGGGASGARVESQGDQPEPSTTGTVARSPSGEPGPGVSTQVTLPPDSVRPESPGSEADAPREFTGLLVAVLGTSTPSISAEFALMDRVGTSDNNTRGLTSTERMEFEGETSSGDDMARLQRLAFEAGFELLLVGDLVTRATPAAGAFFTGSARLTLRLYDGREGRLLRNDRVLIGSSGVPGKLGRSEATAQDEAAQSAGRAAATLVRQWLQERSERDAPTGVVN